MGLVVCPCAHLHDEASIGDGARVTTCCADVAEFTSCQDTQFDQHLRTRVFDQTQLALARGHFEERDWDLGQLQRHRMPPSSLLEYSARCARVYHQKDFTAPAPPPALHGVQVRVSIAVVCTDILDAAARLKEEGFNCCVVSAANPSMPGGGVDVGLDGLEEDLCRRSNLFNSLQGLSAAGEYPIPRGSSAYTPSVCFFRSSRSTSYRWWGPHCFSVVSAPAVDLPEYTDEDMLPRGLQEQIASSIFAALSAAQLNSHDALALPAFGCGAPCHNPPKLVARLFHQLLLAARFQRHFKRVVFAVPEGEKPSLQAFMQQFAHYEK